MKIYLYMYVTEGSTATNYTCIVRVFTNQLHFGSGFRTNRNNIVHAFFLLYTRTRYFLHDQIGRKSYMTRKISLICDRNDGWFEADFDQFEMVQSIWDFDYRFPERNPSQTLKLQFTMRFLFMFFASQYVFSGFCDWTNMALWTQYHWRMLQHCLMWVRLLVLNSNQKLTQNAFLKCNQSFPQSNSLVCIKNRLSIIFNFAENYSIKFRFCLTIKSLLCLFS